MPPGERHGKPIRNLGGGNHQLTLSDSCRDVVVQRSFSNKPKATGAFTDFFDKIESYVAIISGPAIQKYNANPYTFRVVEQAPPDSIFKFHDTLTSRAEITIWSDGLSKTMIAVIGLRGSDSRYAALMLDTNKARIFVFDGETERESSAKSPAALRREDGRRRVISAVPTTSIYFTSLITGAQQTAAHIRFIEDASLLADAGGVGALLRFRI